MAALGAGAGAFTGDIEREKLAIERARLAQQQANADANYALAAQREANSAAHQAYVDTTQRRVAKSADERAEMTSSWANVLNEQRRSAQDADLRKKALEIENLKRIDQEEAFQAEQVKKAREDAMGVAYLTAQSSNGFMRRSAVQQWNKDHPECGGDFTDIGIYNPLTGERYEDGGFHFVKIGKNQNGQMDILKDAPMNIDQIKKINGSDLFKFLTKGHGGSGSSFDERKELKQMDIDARKDRQDAWLTERRQEKELDDERKRGTIKYDPKLAEALQRDINMIRYEDDGFGGPDYEKPRSLSEDDKVKLAQMEEAARNYRWGSIGGFSAPSAEMEDPDAQNGGFGSPAPTGQKVDPKVEALRIIDEKLEQLRRIRESKNAKVPIPNPHL